MIGSPSNLELLLHCYYSPERHERFTAPAIQDGIVMLLHAGMIEPGDAPDTFGATEKGKAFVRHLMTIPFPEMAWVVPPNPKPNHGD